MAGGGVKVDVTKWRALAQLVQDVGERVKNLEPVLKGRAQALDVVVKKSFSSQTDPNSGSAWAPLSEVTKRQKRKNVNRTLRESDQLFKSLHTGARPTSIFLASTATGNVGDYALVQQFGNPDNRMPKRVKGSKPPVWRKDGPSAPIPARPYMPMGEDGKLVFTGGRAREWYTRTIDRIRTYITTGKLSGG